MPFRKHSFLRIPSRMLIALFSLLFLVSTQFCYAMAQDLPLTAEVLVHFDREATRDHPFMFHCHVLEHEDVGMMAQFVTV